MAREEIVPKTNSKRTIPKQKPMVRNVKDSKIISIMYRADTWEQLRFFYPSKEVSYIDEDALLQILHQRKALVEVLQPTVIDGFLAEDVTLLITVGDGDRYT